MDVNVFTALLSAKFAQAQVNQAVGLPGPIEKFTSIWDADARVMNYGFMTPTPGIKRFTGRRDFAQIDQSKYSIENFQFDGEFAVPLRDIRDDKIGMYPLKPQELVTKAGQPFRSRQILTQIANGASTVCHDGTNFFATSHTLGEAGTVAAGFGGGGNSITFTSSNTSDSLTHKFAVLMHPPGQLVRPMIYQNRMAPKFMTDSGTPLSELAQEVKYWIDLEAGFGVGFWWDACLVTITNTPSLIDIFACMDAARQQIRSFILPRVGSQAPAEYAHAYTDFSPENVTFVVSTGLEQLFRHALKEDRVGVSVAGSTAGITSNIFYNYGGLVHNPYFA